MCTRIDCDNRPARRSWYCADCLRRLKKEKAEVAKRWAQAHAEGRLTPEDRAEVALIQGEDQLFLEEYEPAFLLD